MFSARMAVLFVETVADLWRDGDGTADRVTIARELAHALDNGRIILPAAG